MPGQFGNKGGGRKSAYEEFYKTRSINRLWEKIDAKIQAGTELSEYEEKLVLALLPKTIKTETDITSDNKPLPLLAYALPNYNSHEEDNGTEEENTDSTGGN